MSNHELDLNQQIRKETPRAFETQGLVWLGTFCKNS